MEVSRNKRPRCAVVVWVDAEVAEVGGQRWR